MAQMKTIYSKLPSATRFYFPPEKCYIVVEGTNSNQIKTHACAPRKNEIADYHWKYIQDKYGDGSYPHLFTGRKGGDDGIYEAPTENSAIERQANTAPARDASAIVGSDKDIKRYDANDDL